MADTKKKYDGIHVCEKCEATKASIKYCPGISVRDRVRKCDTTGEHIHVTCALCNFGWIEDTADTVMP